jgi:predicted  nucleic acid-binding Zn-ribbon protein
VDFRGRGEPDWISIPSPEVIERLHNKLSGLRVPLPSEINNQSIREAVSKIGENRNTASLVLSKTYPILGRLKSYASRLDRILEAESSIIRDTKKGMLGTKNEKDRQSRINVILDELLDSRAEVKASLCEVQELVSHSKHVIEELRSAFEELSRMLATYELDYRIQRSEG